MTLRPVRRTVLGGASRAALMPAAAFAVHQLRFMIAYGSGSSRALSQTGHAYLHSLAPWLVALVALTAGGFMWSLGRAMAGQRSAPRFTLSLAALWLACTASLVGIYVLQETLEGLLAAGHPAGLAGVLGYGGWWAIPAAAAIALVLAVVFHGARWAIARIAGRTGSRPAPRRRRARPLRPRAALAPRLIPLAAGWSGRGPPRGRV